MIRLRHPRTFSLWLVLPWLLWLECSESAGQGAWLGGRDQWKVRRQVVLENVPQSDREVCVLDFLCHGEITRDTPGLIVTCQKETVPFRVLQQGPGDFVRVAFQTRTGKTRYEIYYGGTAGEPAPQWTARAGLLLAVRAFKDCDLNRLSSVQDAFEQSPPLWSDYVPNVNLGYLPFDESTTPVLSRYTGALNIDKPGKYRFYTSSRDASWLLIDGKQVVAWPGRHGPSGQARYSGEIDLSAGAHKFEYHHASTGSGFMTLAAWQPPNETKIAPLPEAAFGAVHRVKTDKLQMSPGDSIPDFTVESLAEATLGAGRSPLIGVRFLSSTSGVPLQWDFGDGQTETSSNPTHIYLRPGLYTVRCTRPGRRTGTVNLVKISPPWNRFTEEDSQADIADWVEVLNKYDPSVLPAEDLHQLVRVYRELKDESKAVEVGLAGITSRKSGSPLLDPQPTARLAIALCMLLDEEFSRTEEGLKLCDLALDLNPTGDAFAELQTAAATLELRLDRGPECQRRLSRAAQVVNDTSSQETRRRLSEVRGDYYRRIKQTKTARASYQQAEKFSDAKEWDLSKRLAMEGVFSRNAEDYLRSGSLDEAALVLKQWTDMLPSCKLGGYYSLLWSRYCLARQRYQSAVLEAEDLLNVYPDSPYADRLLLVEAEARARQGDTEKSRIALQRILRDYRGSPLGREARGLLENGFPEEKQEPSPRGRSRNQ